MKDFPRSRVYRSLLSSKCVTQETTQDKGANPRKNSRYSGTARNGTRKLLKRLAQETAVSLGLMFTATKLVQDQHTCMSGSRLSRTGAANYAVTKCESAEVVYCAVLCCKWAVNYSLQSFKICCWTFVTIHLPGGFKCISYKIWYNCVDFLMYLVTKFCLSTASQWWTQKRPLRRSFHGSAVNYRRAIGCSTFCFIWTHCISPTERRPNIYVSQNEA